MSPSAERPASLRDTISAPDPEVTMASLAERYEAKVAPVRGADDECWLWAGGKDGDGYGKIREAGRGSRQLRTHRVALMLLGVDVEGRHVHHTCNTPACVNPAHLEVIESHAAHLGIHRGHTNTPRERWTAGGVCRRGHDLNEHARVRKGGRCYSCLACQYEREGARGRV